MFNTETYTFTYIDEDDVLDAASGRALQDADFVLSRNNDGTVSVVKSRHTDADLGAIAAFLGVRPAE